MTSMRTRRAAMLFKLQAAEGVYEDPSAATDGILIEPPTVALNPQNVTTNEVTNSLDSLADIVGGTQVSVQCQVYMKGNGVPGTAPQWTPALKVCSWEEVATLNTITGITFSVTGTDTIADSANGLAALTVGTVFHLVSPANNGVELLAAVSAAGSVQVTKPDGSAPNLTNEAAGGTFTIRYGIAAVDATAGDATSITAQAPWSNTAQAYRGMPSLVSGNPATPFWTSIIDYPATRVAKLSDKFGTPLDNTSIVSIPANMLYRPTSDDSVIKIASMAIYMDGVKWMFSDARGTVRFEMTAAKTWMANFTLSALYVGKTDAAVPSVTYDATRPGVWRDSKCLINRGVAKVSSFTFDLSNNLVFPDDPNQQEGFATPEITARNMTFQADPLATLVATRDLVSAFRNGDQQPIHASLVGGAGAKPGQRIILNIPLGQYNGADPGDRNGLVTEQLRGKATGPDAGAFLAIY